MKTENVRPAPWRSTYIMRPDLNLLKGSILEYGIIYPLVIQADTSYIIDGFARWVAAQSLDIEEIPVKALDLDETDSMIAHVRLNRARGEVVAKDLSLLIQRCLRSGKYGHDDMRELLGMTADEFDILADGSLVKKRKMREHKYSHAWVPVETTGLNEYPQIERPKSPDK